MYIYARVYGVIALQPRTFVNRNLIDYYVLPCGYELLELSSAHKRLAYISVGKYVLWALACNQPFPICLFCDTF